MTRAPDTALLMNCWLLPDPIVPILTSNAVVFDWFSWFWPLCIQFVFLTGSLPLAVYHRLELIQCMILVCELGDMKKKLRLAWLSFRMFWLTFSLRARVAIIAIPIICVVILLYAPGHDYWVLLCDVTLALLPLTLLAIVLLFKEIK